MPYQLDYQMRAPYPPNEDGYYYWTNAWIVNASSDSMAIIRINQVDAAVDGMTLTVVEQVRLNAKRSPGVGGVYHSISLGLEDGDVPTGTSGYLLINYMKVDLYVGERLAGYKRWRMPFRIEDLDGERWTPAAQSIVQSRFNELVAQSTLAARSGEVITGAVVDPLVRQWQLRHGTKRRDRRVIA